jgi:DNA-directed RNA polymerase
MRRPLALQRWLGEVATQAAREQVQLRWIAPSGFPVAIAEWRKSARQIRTHVGQTLWCPKVYDDTDQLDGNAMRQTVPPTFIHSFEAAFLARAVQYAQHLDDPITDVALIHDSIGVHCTALPDLLADDGPIKRAWVDQYTPDYLAAVADCFQEQLADDLPSLPVYGTHQASEVSLSGRFFQT